MHCPSCGHQNRPDARFCDTCGTSLSQGGKAGAIPPSPSQFATQDPGPGGRGWQSSTTMNQPLPTSQPPKRVVSYTSAKPPTQLRGSGGLVGIARSIQMRSEQSGFTGRSGSYQRSTQVLGFRLEQYDSNGNRVRMVSVEMRGSSIIGFINDGEQVEVFGKMEDGQIQTKQVRNLTTGAIVQVKEKQVPKSLQILVMTCLVVFGLLVIAVFALIFIFGFNLFTFVNHFIQQVPTIPTPPSIRTP